MPCNGRRRRHKGEFIMHATINLITIWVNKMLPMKNFYHKVLGFQIKNDLGDYIEFYNNGVRFALCKRQIMTAYSPHYKEKTSGQSFELAFPCDSIEDLDLTYSVLVNMGARPIQAPKNMPWQQRTALFADPEGNIHEIFCELEE